MNKLTIENLLSYKLTHPNGSLVSVARMYSVSPQYVFELWSKHLPNKKFNEAWGATVQVTCKTCGKKNWKSAKEVERGGGVFCNMKCKHYKKYLKIR